MRGAILAAALLVLWNGAAAAEDACHAVLRKRVEDCAQDCLARAKAAVDPEIRGRILGYGCANNCAKLEMFAGHTCPAPQK